MVGLTPTELMPCPAHTKKAVNLFQDLLLSLAASVAAGIQFL